MPYPPGGDCPFAAILSSRNRYYTHFNSHFVEFDPGKRAFTFFHKTVPQMAMSMTEDDDGRIWSGTYPNSAVACYQPGTGEFRDYGNLYDQNWRQYPRAIAADDTGWVYFGIGSTASQIVSLDPESGRAEPLLTEDERTHAHALVYRDLNGRVYGHTSGGSEDGWMELYRGKRTDVGRIENRSEKPIIAGSQGLFHTDFPDGKRMVSCSLVERTLAVEDPGTGETREVSFDYSSEGAHIMGVATAPDNTICGGTAFPMHFFSFNPVTGSWINRPALGQWNTVAREGDMFFIGAYTHGLLEAWDPARPWVHTERDKAGCNPELLYECHEVINRPHMLLAHPNARTVVLAGTPGYGLTGGGLLFLGPADPRVYTAGTYRHPAEPVHHEPGLPCPVAGFWAVRRPAPAPVANRRPTKRNSILWIWKRDGSIGTRSSSPACRDIPICARGRMEWSTASPIAGAFSSSIPVAEGWSTSGNSRPNSDPRRRSRVQEFLLPHRTAPSSSSLRGVSLSWNPIRTIYGCWLNRPYP